MRPSESLLCARMRRAPHGARVRSSWLRTLLACTVPLILLSFDAAANDGWTATLRPGFEYQFESDIDSGGDFDYWQASFEAAFSGPISGDWSARILTEYRALGYDFSGAVAGGIDPWDDVHVVRVTPILNYALDENWSLFGGGIFEFSGENGASFDDSLRGGGLAGFNYRWSDRLTIGLGALVRSEIEGNARVRPVINLNWKISDTLLLTTDSSTSRGGMLELAWAFAEAWEAAFAGGFHSERFRLDSGPGPQSKGVGEESSFPLSLRLSHTFGERVRLDLFGGVVLDGEFKAKNTSGNTFASSDYDETPFVGLAFKIPF